MRLKDTGLTAQELKDMVNKYMIETYVRFDFVADTAKGMYMYDENGVEYLDFYAGIAVNSVGNCNEKVVKAIQDQAGQIMQTFNYPYTVPQALLSKLICDTIGMDKIFYQNSGAEANEAMIKIARKYGHDNYGPKRYKIITAKKSFHGRTMGTLSATGQTDNAIHKGFNPLLDDFIYADFNDVESFRAACDDTTIAIMFEPIMAEGGVFPATQEFMDGIRALCDEKGMLLLLDEIQTGWCRTGEVMCYMNYNVKPDVVSMAKAMGGGMPIGAIACTDKVAKTFGMGAHGSTFGGHPVTCAASLAAIEEMLEKDLAKNAKEMGAYFSEKLRELPHVKEVRGQGLLVGVEFDQEIGGAVKNELEANKMLVTAIGASMIRMVPPLILEKKHIDDGVKRIKAAIEAVAK